MTVERLKQYRSIKAEINELAAQIKQLEQPDVVEGSDDEWPYIKHNFKVQGTEKCAGTLRLLRKKQRELKAEYHALNKFINDIPDSETRRIFRLRYIDGKTFQWIAFRLCMTDEQIPRKKHNKFLNCTKSTKIP